MTPRVRCLSVALGVLGCTLAAPTTGSASPSLTIGGTAELEGTHYFDSLVVSGVLRVPRRSGGNRLVLIAQELRVDATGVLDATGAGAQGLDGGNGESPTGSVSGGGNPAGGSPAPGGGGGNAKNGLPAFDALCQPLLDLGGNPTAGQALDLAGTLFLPGAAGGAFVPPPFVFDTPPPTRGGAGGGVIEIYADSLVNHGVIRANGEDGLGSNFFAVDPTVSAGGGAGGSVIVHARTITGLGTIEVRGGDGSGAAPGGGGSGGLVLVHTPDPATFPLTLVLSAGTSGLCTDPDHDGLRVDAQMGGCLDMDGDGFGGEACLDGTGTDCNDADPAVHPEGSPVLERCDGVDNDCDGGIDLALEVPCPDGTHCEMGACLADEPPPPVTVPPKPDRIDFVGACSVEPHGAGRSAPWALATVALAAGAAFRRRRR